MLFTDLSLETWLSRHKPPLRQALKHKQAKDTCSLNAEQQTALHKLYTLLSQPQMMQAYKASANLQTALLKVLAHVPLLARLRFLELLAKSSLPLVSMLMDETLLHDGAVAEAQYVHHSIKHLYALSTMIELFNTDNLALIIKLFEEHHETRSR